MTESTDPVAGVTCPMCGAAAVDVVEELAAGVVVYACDECAATWADRVATRPEQAER